MQAISLKSSESYFFGLYFRNAETAAWDLYTTPSGQHGRNPGTKSNAPDSSSFCPVVLEQKLRDFGQEPKQPLQVQGLKE